MASFMGAPVPVAQYDRYNRYLIPEYTLDTPLHPGASGARKLAPGDAVVPWTRVSTIAKTMSATKQLEDWRMRLLVKGMGLRPDLYALAAATPVDEKSKLSDIADQAMDAAAIKAAANLGTAIHAFAEAADAEEDVKIPEPWRADVEAYQSEMDRWGIELIPGMQELRVINPRWADGGAAGVGGRFDRIVMYKGKPTVLDLKSGSDPLKYGAGAIAMQLWLYSTSWAIWDGSMFRNLPKGLNTEMALVAHVPAGKGVCRIVEVDLTGAEEAVELSMAVRAWRRSSPDLVELGGDEPDDMPEKLAAAKPAKKAVAKKVVGSVGDAVKEKATEKEESARVKKTNGVVMDGTGKKPLAPLAGPGQMGCSVCGRTGHRRTSAKCLGENDPVFSSDAVTDELGEPQDHEPEHVESEHVPAKKVAKADPFEDEDDSMETGTDWADMLRSAGSKNEIREIRGKAKAAGDWSQDLLDLALARLDELG